MMAECIPAKWKQPCSEKHLCEISNEIAQWKNVAPDLDLTEVDVVNIVESHPDSVRLQRRAMLNTWRQKLGKKATYKKLAKAFKKCGRQDLVDKIRELLTNDSSSSSDETEGSNLFCQHEVTQHSPATAPCANPCEHHVCKITRIIQEKQAEHEKLLKSLQNKHKSQLEKMKAESELQIKTLQETLKSQSEEMKIKKAELESQIKTLQDKHKLQQEKMKAELEVQIETLQDAHKSQLEKMKQEKAELELQIKTLQDKLKSQLEKMKAEFELQIKTLQDKHKSQLEQEKAKLKLQLKKLEEKLESQSKHMEQEKADHKMQLKRSQDKHTLQLVKKEQEKAELEFQVKNLQGMAKMLQEQIKIMEQKTLEFESAPFMLMNPEFEIGQSWEERLTQPPVNPPTVDMKYSPAEQVEKVFQKLCDNTFLRELNVDSTSLTADSMATLSSSLNKNITLRSLTLGNCALDDHAVEKMSAGLHMNTSLRTLDLSSNPRITDTGASHLAVMLAENNILKELVLSSCSISDSGVHHLSKQLQFNSHMTELHLSFNQAITNTGALALSDMIRVNNSLRRLFLEGTSVGEEGAAALMESLLHNDTVTELWLPDRLAEYCMRHSVYEEVKNVVCF